ncbi:hypothetical protein A3D05_01110 [Candidatus Gottesmanbacteria bacterium RIFCSPHIGHO2_02_FULL_40_24]|uniref:YtxH domain-containing protein n=1 Tax=Candidatus Gottesmanbacteria bacterium RIFCSPHIGHO2_01_FULL_40_15 TaxID=1798376 RepID=A0A1F5Z5S5_9BACT|nr:MAG: hypothetical protein A2777_02760 [Candidatus Gottesmanbacteria bacterium RIFCSPHIGHO2_01_FULL_40_15]OGG18334.1 MAG: hypothetical protein A3D05_01110 [Candidatus Gottesmanbacteria bacterium RIFCSPHIGHO2_02_FULL_40_24]OGG21337.1 MAG: hypothetical protein A3B48_02395 [Candidatus Gottesmanbacteria bacterium RIFCSPLOWO2_01_FULL_40_10]OGG25988.1 MAG: hypothetical protein A3E42_02335 [Candidatus Gottesmanbacteria bacterium RIFCSPHIGHO2_12_FULL_40_13]OGG32126.1 MAG: hypothetical protein A3I80_0
MLYSSDKRTKGLSHLISAAIGAVVGASALVLADKNKRQRISDKLKEMKKNTDQSVRDQSEKVEKEADKAKDIMEKKG